MGTAKQRIRLTRDNVEDYLDLSDLEDLVGRLAIGPGGVPPHGRAVGKFLEWLNARNAGSSVAEYVCSPADAAAILEHVAGVREDFDLPLDWQLSKGFRRLVLEELVQVPYGQTVSYKDLAERAGNPKASRAAGTAMATNPIAVVVPCHRCLRTSGDLGGYGGGLDAKVWLLHLEGSRLIQG